MVFVTEILVNGQAMLVGSFNAAGITHIQSIDISTVIVPVDDSDEITVDAPANKACRAWVDGHTLYIAGNAGGGDIVGGLNLQLGFSDSASGLDSLVQAKVPRNCANLISIRNIQH